MPEPGNVTSSDADNGLEPLDIDTVRSSITPKPGISGPATPSPRDRAPAPSAADAYSVEASISAKAGPRALGRKGHKSSRKGSLRSSEYGYEYEYYTPENEVEGDDYYDAYYAPGQDLADAEQLYEGSYYTNAQYYSESYEQASLDGNSKGDGNPAIKPLTSIPENTEIASGIQDVDRNGVSPRKNGGPMLPMLLEPATESARVTGSRDRYE